MITVEQRDRMLATASSRGVSPQLLGRDLGKRPPHAPSSQLTAVALAEPVSGVLVESRSRHEATPVAPYAPLAPRIPYAGEGQRTVPQAVRKEPVLEVQGKGSHEDTASFALSLAQSEVVDSFHIAPLKKSLGLSRAREVLNAARTINQSSMSNTDLENVLVQKIAIRGLKGLGFAALGALFSGSGIFGIAGAAEIAVVIPHIALLTLVPGVALVGIAGGLAYLAFRASKRNFRTVEVLNNLKNLVSEKVIPQAEPQPVPVLPNMQTSPQFALAAMRNPDEISSSGLPQTKADVLQLFDTYKPVETTLTDSDYQTSFEGLIRLVTNVTGEQIELTPKGIAKLADLVEVDRDPQSGKVKVSPKSLFYKLTALIASIALKDEQQGSSRYLQLRAVYQELLLDLRRELHIPIPQFV